MNSSIAGALSSEYRGPRMVHSFWRDVALVLMGILLTISGWWVTAGRDTVSRKELTEAVQSIQGSVQSIQLDVATVKAQLEAMRERTQQQQQRRRE
jgi:hypothetical protein